MSLRQNIYAVLVALIVLCVTIFALENFQDVDVTIPFVGIFHTKLFVVIVFSFFLGLLTAGFLSLVLKILSLPALFRRESSETGHVSESFKGGEKKK